MKLPRPAWLAAITASLAAITLTAVLHVLFPVGKQDAARYAALDEVIGSHLATIDNRLQEIELYADSPIACPHAWSDTIRQGATAYTLNTTVLLAHYDDVRRDWVPTCDEDAEYYAVTVEGAWRNAPAPQITEYATPRYYGLAETHFNTETIPTTAADEALPAGGEVRELPPGPAAVRE